MLLFIGKLKFSKTQNTSNDNLDRIDQSRKLGGNQKEEPLGRSEEE